jgi:hypothetical protein
VPAPRTIAASAASVLISFFVVASCSDDATSAGAPLPTGDGAASSGDGASSQTMDGASALETSTTLDAAAGPDGSGADAKDVAPPPACNSLVDLSAGVVPVKKSGSSPTPTGGSFAGETFVLTKVEYWGGTLSGTWHGTYRFSASGYEYTDGTYTEQGEVIFSPTYDDQWTQRADCPTTSGGPWQFYFFSASGNEFVLHTEAPDGPRLRTFTRLSTDAGDGG